MSQSTDRESYDGVAKTLHWLIFIVLAAQYTVAYTMPHIGRHTKAEGLVAWHLSLGTTILFLMLLRLLWRLRHPAPAPPRDLPRVLRWAAQVTHAAIYAVLIVLPFMGWTNASSRGYPVRLFGVIPLPPLSPVGSEFGHELGDLHADVAIFLLVLIGIHVCGALYHFLVATGPSFQRMLPRRWG